MAQDKGEGNNDWCFFQRVSDGRKSIRGIARFQRGEEGINEEKNDKYSNSPR